MIIIKKRGLGYNAEIAKEKEETERKSQPKTNQSTKLDHYVFM